jgi:hypothetical protein
LWSRDGTELFFRTRSGDVMAVPVKAGETFQSGNPVKLFTAPQFVSDEYSSRRYDVAPDGRRFIMMRGSAKNSQSIGVVLNWATEINQLSARK